eukprot:TRINITY_DN15613_c0_g4_i1.p1 TRINITY_DN15613_c0_g4~~TRINITY_DN15613_c0_g4_i1.p1  ORF type:complete len:453 (-),score=67.05 TRINITY_DN15613_c0_g4_i1:206-1564(-)
MAIHMQRRATSLRLQLGGAPATRHCSLRTGKENLRTQGCSPRSLGVKLSSPAVREVPLRSARESTSTSSSMPNQAKSDLKWEETPHNPSTFEIVATTLAGASATVEASSIHSVARVKELVAAGLGVGCYRVNLTTPAGVELKENTKTLADFGIVSDVELVAVLGEANRWRDMTRNEFIEILVEFGVVESQEKARFLFQSVRHEKQEYVIRRRYITQLERVESEKERIRRREDAKRHIADEVGAIISGAANKAEAVKSLSEHISAVIDVRHRESVEESERLAEEAELKLAVALPAIRNAEQALDVLCKDDFCELRALKAPPPAVNLAMMAICIFFHHEPTMDNVKKLLCDFNLHQKMRNYDKDSLSADVIRKLEPFLSNDMLHPDAVCRASGAAAGCAMWAHAMVTHYRVVTSVIPLQNALNKALQDEEDSKWQRELWMNYLSELQAQTQEVS